MYNRYIPQPDGSYRKNRMPDPQKPPPPPPAPPVCPPPKPPAPKPPKPRPAPPSPPPGSFWQRLLPAGLDTEDLLVLTLLLLIAGDQEEHRTGALLTLALYFFL